MRRGDAEDSGGTCLDAEEVGGIEDGPLQEGLFFCLHLTQNA